MDSQENVQLSATGGNAKVPSIEPSSGSDDGYETNLGDLLSGRLSDVGVDSVETVREIWEWDLGRDT